MNVPRTWVDSEVITAEMMNTEIRDQVNDMWNAIGLLPSHRQGGNATNWSYAGTSNYEIIDVPIRMQVGYVETASDGKATVTFPVAFASQPLIFLSAYGTNTSNSLKPIPTYGNITSTGLEIQVTNPNASTGIYSVSWLAIGPA